MTEKLEGKEEFSSFKSLVKLLACGVPEHSLTKNLSKFKESGPS